MHKKIKLFVSMLAAAAMLVLLPGGNTLTARAEANTYSIKYLVGSGDWRCVDGSTFGENQYHYSIEMLRSQKLKDGDHIVIYDSGDIPPSTKHLDLSGFNLGSVTVHNGVTVVFFADSIKDCYVLADAYASINGNVTNAFVYDTTVCTFNNDVLEMELYYTTAPASSITCGGTVGHFSVWTKDKQTRWNHFYDISKMNFDAGTVQFNWSPTPSESYLQAKAAADGTAPADTAATPAPGSAKPAPGTAADEYDAVPKTGGNSHIIWLAGAAALLFAASFCLYRKAK